MLKIEAVFERQDKGYLVSLILNVESKYKVAVSSDGDEYDIFISSNEVIMRVRIDPKPLPNHIMKHYSDYSYIEIEGYHQISLNIIAQILQTSSIKFNFSV